MPAKGSCCCEIPDTHGAATMWLLDFNYGTVLQDFNYVLGGSPISVACAFDESYNEAAEVGNTCSALWEADPPESRIWGPLSSAGSNGPIGGFTESYFWHGAPPAAGIAGVASGTGTTEARLRSDGSVYTHGMTGGLLRVDDSHIYTVSNAGLIYRKYTEDGTLIATGDMTGQNNGAFPSYSGEGLHFALQVSGAPSGHNHWDAVDPVTMSHSVDYFDVDVATPFADPASAFGNDESGGLLLYRSVPTPDEMEYWSGGGSTSPVWSGVPVPTGFTASNLSRFGRNNSVYGTRLIATVMNLTRITTTDGSVVWNEPVPAGIDVTTILRSKVCFHNGIIYMAMNDLGVWAVDEATGDTLWHQTDVVCGRGLPVATPLGLLCCGVYS